MTESGWNYADLWESVAAFLPDEPVVIQGSESLSWRDFDAQANGLAAHFLAAGLTHQSKVGIYAQNCAEFLVATFAAFNFSFS